MFSRKDLGWLNTSPYGLKHVKGGITGRLFFDMTYDPHDRSYAIWPEPQDLLRPGVIHHSDDYEISIFWGSPSDVAPSCIELGSKIAETAKSKSLDIIELHVSGGDRFCLAAPQDLQLAFAKGFSLKRYIEEFVIPFLFQQTHFRKHGEWAWPPAAHYSAGIFGWYHEHGHEEYALQLTVLGLSSQLRKTPKEIALWVRTTEYKADMPCRCESGKEVLKCCPESLYGYNRLRLDLGGSMQVP
jgi:hypothetical protein